MRHNRMNNIIFWSFLLGPKRAAKGILLGIAGGILFWIFMGIMISSQPADVDGGGQPIEAGALR